MEKLNIRFLDGRLSADSEKYGKICGGEDFFRLFVDDLAEREIKIRSSEQKPASVTEKDGELTIVYDCLHASNGQTYDIVYKVTIREKDGALAFGSVIENRSGVRVNEEQLPYIELEGGEKETLYMPHGLGSKVEDPRRAIPERFHSEYMSADEKMVFYSVRYPTPLSMSWFGVQTDGRFLYLAAHDEKLRICTLSAGASARHDPIKKLVLTVSHYPTAVSGETVSISNCVLALFDGDWRDGAAYYREFADSTWNTPSDRPTWVDNMTGWQRVILKHQFGEIYFKYSDLPKLYKSGLSYGINTLMVFGWWKGRFDNGYPVYEPDPLLGGEDGLRAAIDEIHRLGGKVHLYTNGALIDVATDYYKTTGKYNCAIDIDGNEYRDHYRFSNEGTTLKMFGYKSFVTACHATKAWHEHILDAAKIKLSLGADGVFYDQLPVTSQLCFCEKHEHGLRTDLDAEYRLGNIRAAKAVLPKDHAIGSETAVDRFTSLLHYIHGCFGSMGYSPDAFPDMFRQTFPEPVISNREIYDAKPGFKKHWNYAFVTGLIFDVSTNRGRSFDMSGYPESAEYIKKLLCLKEKYHRFFYGGKYSSAFDLGLPRNVFGAFYDSEGDQICALCNNTDAPTEVEVYGAKHMIDACDCLVVERK